MSHMRAAIVTGASSGIGAAGVVFSSNPATGINCGSTNTACTASFSSGTVVTLTEVAPSTNVFAGWSGAQGCGNNQTTCVLTMNAAAAVTATFLPTLSLAVSGMSSVGTHFSVSHCSAIVSSRAAVTTSLRLTISSCSSTAAWPYR